MLYKKAILKNLTKFIGKSLRRRPSVNEVAGTTCNFVKASLYCKYSPVNCAQHFRTTTLKKTREWLLLTLVD